MRSPVGITKDDSGGLVVVCSDGSVFTEANNGGWEEVTPIPGTRREDQELAGDGAKGEPDPETPS